MQTFVRRCRRPSVAKGRMRGPGIARPLFSFQRKSMQPRAKELRTRLFAPLLALAGGIALSLGLFAYVHDDLKRDGELRFERRAADARHIIEHRLQSYVGVTEGLRALFAAREQV